MPPHRRPVGYVFQEASLFPHLSVRQKLLFGAKRAPKDGTGPLVFDELIALLGIGPLLDRGPLKLSGGAAGGPACGSVAPAGGILTVPGYLGEEGKMRRMQIVATDVSLTRRRPSESTITNVMPVRITEQRPVDQAQLNMSLALEPDGSGDRILARVTRKSMARVTTFPPSIPSGGTRRQSTSQI